MKSKRLLSVLVAAAMVAGSMPATVFAGRLDYEPEETEVTEITEPEEKETTKPSVKETKPDVKESEPEVKETEPEAPKETEKTAEQPDETIPETEAPAETEKPEAEQSKETEAPAETEKPAEEAPEETDKPVAEAPKESEKPVEETHKVPAKNAAISNVAISQNGILSWDAVADTNDYLITINGYEVWLNSSYGTSYDLNKEIDYDIKVGLMTKPGNNTYKIKVSAFKSINSTDEVVIAESDELTYIYKTPVSFIKVTSMSGIKWSGKNLVWNKVKGAVKYSVDVSYIGNFDTANNSYAIGTVIDDHITNRTIYKSSNDKYSFYLSAYDGDDVLLAEWSGYITYKTSAVPYALPALTNVSISKEGILTWEAYPSAAGGYSARIIGANDYIWAYVDDPKTLLIDLKKNISEAVGNGFEELSSYKIELYANDDNGDPIAESVSAYKYKEVNTLSVKGKTVKAKKSKAKKKNQSFKVKKVLTIKKAVGKVTYAKVSGNAKIVINKTTGKLTVMKKIKKGTYKVRITVKAAGNSVYAPSAKTVIVKVKVR